ncbi:MAG TPA: thermonuclease family protein [Xanthobacteraceae bacterium]|nr:thermonuclease family protein [Xanthobacteraceae bacterium]
MRVELRTLSRVVGFLALVAFIAVATINYDRWSRSAAAVPEKPSSVVPHSLLTRFSAVDGDSLRRGNEDFRLVGIDAPELSQRCLQDGREWACGRAAHERLKQLVARGDVQCAAQGRDRYGRTLARCSAGGTDIGETLVHEGLAVDFMQGGYARQERDARIARRGIWTGEFDLPQEHRRGSPPRAQR